VCSRFGVGVLSNSVLESGNEENLPGTEPSPFDGGATFSRRSTTQVLEHKGFGPLCGVFLP